MNWVNWDDVQQQLLAAGFDSTDRYWPPDVGRLRRCKVEGCTQKGWYSLHEIRLDDGREALVGAYGGWKGAEKFQANIALRIDGVQQKLDADQAAAAKRRVAEAKQEADRRRAGEAKRAAEEATRAWGKYSTSGHCDYLDDKRIQAHGVKFTHPPADAKHGQSLVIPMQDTQGRIHGLQLIYPKGHHKRAKTGRNKDFWPYGLAKSGHFFPIGVVRDLVLIAEGYATAATLFEATGLPVIVAFDAGNLQAVAVAVKQRWKHARILICADDDFQTEGNPGVAKAAAAALAVGGAWVKPEFAVARAAKLTDFNDLALLEGSAVVAQQITQRLAVLGWDRAAPAAPKLHAGGEGNAARDDLRAIESLDELQERFALVYEMADTVFDHQEHKLVPLASSRNICVNRMLHRQWMESREKQVVRVAEVGFDPAGRDHAIKCNLWGGWPTKPKAGKCDRLLELGEFLCCREIGIAAALWHWVRCWLAYPIQHPGAKMATALVMHGPQGTGKNMFFEAVMAIYGEYGRIVDQAAIEDKFNDWASRRLFLIGDEVVARMELYHTKNKLKSLITGEWIRINPKNVGAYDERNHVNIVFQSNEDQPLVLERDDRRYTVIKTPDKLTQDFYDAVAVEIREGGISALHDYLLNYPLGDFNPHTKPPMTAAKADLIDMGKDSTERFYDDWIAKHLPLPVVTCKSEDFYDAYRWWCQRQGIGKPAQSNTLLSRSAGRSGAAKARKHVYDDLHNSGRHQAMLLYPPGADTAADIRALTEQWTEFRNALIDWKDEANVSPALRRVK